jgi:membrane-associated phospholipid phosphatase
VEIRTRILLVVALTAAMLYAWLGMAVAAGATMHFDLAVRNAVHNLASPPLTVAMHCVTQLASTWFVIAAGLAIVWRLAARGQRRTAWLFVTVVAGAEIGGQLLKLVSRRPRPEAFFQLTEPLSYSYPSGHAMTSCCM